jgi:hypothetical protein
MYVTHLFDSNPGTINENQGIQPFDHQSRSSLMEIIEDRHGKRSTIITSQLPIKGYYEVNFMSIR